MEQNDSDNTRNQRKHDQYADCSFDDKKYCGQYPGPSLLHQKVIESPLNEPSKMERWKILEDRMDFATEKNDADSTEDQNGQDHDYHSGTDYSLDSDYSIDSDDMYRL